MGALVRRARGTGAKSGRTRVPGLEPSVAHSAATSSVEPADRSPSFKKSRRPTAARCRGAHLRVLSVFFFFSVAGEWVDSWPDPVVAGARALGHGFRSCPGPQEILYGGREEK